METFLLITLGEQENQKLASQNPIDLVRRHGNNNRLTWTKPLNL